MSTVTFKKYYFPYYLFFFKYTIFSFFHYYVEESHIKIYTKNEKHHNIIFHSHHVCKEKEKEVLKYGIFVHDILFKKKKNEMSFKYLIDSQRF